jgi:ABC-2 type transport system permease protein
MIEKLERYRFVFEERSSAIIKKKVKRKFCAWFWIVLRRCLQLLVVFAVFNQFLGRNTPN